MERQEHVRREHQKSDSLRIKGRSRAYFDERVSVARREDHRVVQSDSRVLQTEVRGRGIQKDPRSFAPQLAGLGHVVQSDPEVPQRLLRTEHSTNNRGVDPLLVHDVDEERPEPTCADLPLEEVFTEEESFQLSVCDDEEIGKFDSELPLVDEVQNGMTENENTLCDVVLEELHASQIDEDGRVALMLRFDAASKRLSVSLGERRNESGFLGISQHAEDFADAEIGDPVQCGGTQTKTLSRFEFEFLKLLIHVNEERPRPFFLFITISDNARLLEALWRRLKE